MGCCDKWEFAVVCPASNGQAQFTRDPAQWDEALLNLQQKQEQENWKGSEWVRVKKNTLHQFIFILY